MTDVVCSLNVKWKRRKKVRANRPDTESQEPGKSTGCFVLSVMFFIFHLGKWE